MAQADLANYKNLYLQTAKEYIGKMIASLSQLSANISDKEALNNLHISSHSLRSQSQVMGFTNMASLCAIIEKIFKVILEDVNQINSDLISVLKESVEALSSCLSQIEKENKEKDLSFIEKRLEEYVKQEV